MNLQDCDQIIQLSTDHTRVARAMYMKGEALQYLGKKEEAESVLKIANTLEPERKSQIEKNTGTTAYSTKKENFKLIFLQNLS